MAITHFVGDKFVGLSTDTKPTGYGDGATFIELDTRNQYLLTGHAWYLMSYSTSSGSSGIMGVGTANYLTKWTSTSTLGDVPIYELGGRLHTNIGIVNNAFISGTNISGYNLNIINSGTISGYRILTTADYVAYLTTGEADSRYIKGNWGITGARVTGSSPISGELNFRNNNNITLTLSGQTIWLGVTGYITTGYSDLRYLRLTSPYWGTRKINNLSGDITLTVDGSSSLTTVGNQLTISTPFFGVTGIKVTGSNQFSGELSIQSLNNILAILDGNTLTISSTGLMTSGEADSKYYSIYNPSGFITSAQIGGVRTLNSISGDINIVGLNSVSVDVIGQDIRISATEFITTGTADTRYARFGWGITGLKVTGSNTISGEIKIISSNKINTILQGKQILIQSSGLITTGDADSRYAPINWGVINMSITGSDSISGNININASNNIRTTLLDNTILIDSINLITSGIADQTYYPKNTNPSGYLTNTTIGGVRTLNNISGNINIIGYNNIDVNTIGQNINVTVTGYITSGYADNVYYPKNTNPSGYLTINNIGGVRKINDISGEIVITGFNNIVINKIGQNIYIGATHYITSGDVLNNYAKIGWGITGMKITGSQSISGEIQLVNNSNIQTLLLGNQLNILTSNLITTGDSDNRYVRRNATESITGVKSFMDNIYVEHVWPVIDNTYNLGTSSRWFNSLYVQLITTDSINNIRVDERALYDSGNNQVLNYSGKFLSGTWLVNDLTPSLNTYDLGSSTFRWNNIYGNIGDFNHIKNYITTGFADLRYAKLGWGMTGFRITGSNTNSGLLNIISSNNINTTLIGNTLLIDSINLITSGDANNAYYPRNINPSGYLTNITIGGVRKINDISGLINISGINNITINTINQTINIGITGYITSGEADTKYIKSIHPLGITGLRVTGSNTVSGEISITQSNGIRTTLIGNSILIDSTNLITTGSANDTYVNRTHNQDITGRKTFKTGISIDTDDNSFSLNAYSSTNIGLINAVPVITTANPFNFAHNILFNARKRYNVNVISGSITDTQIDALFNGKYGEQIALYTGTNLPLVLEISGINTRISDLFIQSQTSDLRTKEASIGWTSRYWSPTSFKIEIYDDSAYYAPTGWLTVSDYTQDIKYNQYYYMERLTGIGYINAIRFTFISGNVNVRSIQLGQLFLIHNQYGPYGNYFAPYYETNSDFNKFWRGDGTYATLTGYITSGEVNDNYYPKNTNPSGYLTSATVGGVQKINNISGLINLSGGHYINITTINQNIKIDATGYITTGYADIRYASIYNTFITTGNADNAYYPKNTNPSGYLTNTTVGGVKTLNGISGDININNLNYITINTVGQNINIGATNYITSGEVDANYAKKTYGITGFKITGSNSISGEIQLINNSNIQTILRGNQINILTTNLITSGESDIRYARLGWGVTGIQVTGSNTISGEFDIQGSNQIQTILNGRQLTIQSTNLITTGDADNRYVRRNADESITGIKIFINNLIVNANITGNTINATGIYENNQRILTQTEANKTYASINNTWIRSGDTEDKYVRRNATESITGVKTFVDNVYVDNIIPNADGTYSLGSATARFSNIYGRILRDSNDDAIISNNTRTLYALHETPVLDWQAGLFYNPSSGVWRFQGYYPNIVQKGFNTTLTGGLKITTTYPITGMIGMPTLFIKGYSYGDSRTIDLTYTWYVYGTGDAVSVLNRSASTCGGIAPNSKLAFENGKIVIWVDLSGVYFPRVWLSAYDVFTTESTLRPQYFTGWVIEDAYITTTNPNHIFNFDYVNTFQNLVSDNLRVNVVSGHIYNYITSGIADLTYYPRNSNPSGYLTASTMGGVRTLNNISGDIDIVGLNNITATVSSQNINLTVTGYITSGDADSRYIKSIHPIGITGLKISGSNTISGEIKILGSNQIQTILNGNQLLIQSINLITSGDANTTYYPRNGNPSGYLTSSTIGGVQHVNSISGDITIAGLNYVTVNTVGQNINIGATNYITSGDVASNYAPLNYGVTGFKITGSNAISGEIQIVNTSNVQTILRGNQINIYTTNITTTGTADDRYVRRNATEAITGIKTFTNNTYVENIIPVTDDTYELGDTATAFIRTRTHYIYDALNRPKINVNEGSIFVSDGSKASLNYQILALQNVSNTGTWSLGSRDDGVVFLNIPVDYRTAHTNSGVKLTTNFAKAGLNIMPTLRIYGFVYNASGKQQLLDISHTFYMYNGDGTGGNLTIAPNPVRGTSNGSFIPPTQYGFENGKLVMFMNMTGLYTDAQFLVQLSQGWWGGTAAKPYSNYTGWTITDSDFNPDGGTAYNVVYTNQFGIINADHITNYITTGFADNRYVRRNADESITGVKTFINTINTNTILPTTDFSYDLGSPSYRWSTIYGTLYSGGTIRTAILAHGSDYANKYINMSGPNIYNGTIQVNVESGKLLDNTNLTSIDWNNKDIAQNYTTRALLPITTSTYDLGSTIYYYGNVYTTGIILNASPVLSPITNGKLQYNGSHLYFDIGSNRYQLDQPSIINGITGLKVTGSNTVSGEIQLMNNSNVQTILRGNRIYFYTNNLITSGDADNAYYPKTANPSGYLTSNTIGGVQKVNNISGEITITGINNLTVNTIGQTVSIGITNYITSGDADSKYARLNYGITGFKVTGSNSISGEIQILNSSNVQSILRGNQINIYTNNLITTGTADDRYVDRTNTQKVTGYKTFVTGIYIDVNDNAIALDTNSSTNIGIFNSAPMIAIANPFNFANNMLFNARKRCTITVVSGSITNSQLDSLFNGNCGSPVTLYTGTNLPLVIEISGVGTSRLTSTFIQSQTSDLRTKEAAFGWATRYYYPTCFKVEAYDDSNYYGPTGWLTIADYTTNLRYNKYYYMERLTGIGYINALRLTFISGNSSAKTIQLSQLFLIHNEFKPYEYFLAPYYEDNLNHTQFWRGDGTYATLTGYVMTGSADDRYVRRNAAEAITGIKTFMDNMNVESVLPVADNTYNLGSASKTFVGAYTNLVTVDGNTNIDVANRQLEITGSIITLDYGQRYLSGTWITNSLNPSLNTYDLGSSTFRWNNAYINILDATHIKNYITTGFADQRYLRSNYGMTGYRVTGSNPVSGELRIINNSNVQTILRGNEISILTTNLTTTGTADDRYVRRNADENITGTKRFLSNVQTQGLTPTSDFSYDLGTPLVRWSTIYGTLYSGGTVRVAQVAHGSDYANKYISMVGPNIYNGSTQVSCLSGRLVDSTNLTSIDWNTKDIAQNYTTRALLPSVTATYDLGSATYDYGNVYATGLILNTSTVLSPTTDGKLQYNGTHLYFDIGSTRYQIDQQASAAGVTGIKVTGGNAVIGEFQIVNGSNVQTILRGNQCNIYTTNLITTGTADDRFVRRNADESITGIKRFITNVTVGPSATVPSGFLYIYSNSSGIPLTVNHNEITMTPSIYRATGEHLQHIFTRGTNGEAYLTTIGEIQFNRSGTYHVVTTVVGSSKFGNYYVRKYEHVLRLGAQTAPGVLPLEDVTNTTNFPNFDIVMAALGSNITIGYEPSPYITSVTNNKLIISAYADTGFSYEWKWKATVDIDAVYV